jgi:glycosyltransferase involved in cell wall biosynthesis
MKLSICCITFNHAKFIAQTFDSFLLQKTSFDFEIVVSDDCSRDATLSIINTYVEKYPDKIKLLANTENIGMMRNFIQAMTACSGKYIALCEGDDYWTDPFKLQKQLDFLEENEDYTICFHEAVILYEDGKEVFFNNLKKDTTFDFFDLTQKNFISTASCIFRINESNCPLPEWFSRINTGDWALHLLNASKGKIYFMKDCMSVYRIHSNGVWTSLSSRQKMEKGIQLMDQLNAIFNFKFNEYFEKGKIRRLTEFNERVSVPVTFKQSFKEKIKRKIKYYFGLQA